MNPDVSVSDINEIYIFSSSLDSFAKDYSQALYSLATYSADDKSEVQRIYHDFYRRYNDAAEEYKSAVRAYEDACQNAADDESGYWKSEVRARRNIVREKQEIYNRLDKQLEKVRELVEMITPILDTVYEESQSAKRQFDQISQDAVKIIREAADKISEYCKNK